MENEDEMIKTLEQNVLARCNSLVFLCIYPNELEGVISNKTVFF